MQWAKTSEDGPGPPQRLNVSQPSKTEVKLIWEPPLAVGSVVNYTVEYKGSKSYWTSFSDTNNYTTNVTTLLIGNLAPDTRYEFWLYATAVCGDSPNVNATTNTDIDVPLPADVTTVEYHNDTDTVVGNVTLWKTRQRNGEINTNDCSSKYHITTTDHYTRCVDYKLNKFNTNYGSNWY
ncbi:hypothetical protein QZH41_000876 [Actinostola sp. cb2023]|nr:hypothetical protein QZH41_000876 [Actinostola sp. cb2023]